jgi:hypothetical protein
MKTLIKTKSGTGNEYKKRVSNTNLNDFNENFDKNEKWNGKRIRKKSIKERIKTVLKIFLRCAGKK